MHRWPRAAAPFLLVLFAAVSGCGHQIDSPPTKADAVQPNLVCIEQLTTRVTLTGDGFTPMPSKLLEQPPQLILPAIDLVLGKNLDGTAASAKPVKVPDDAAHPDQSQVHWTSEKSMSFQVTPGLIPPGLYDVVVTNPDGAQKATFTGGLLGVPRPTLTAPVPDVLCDAEDDQTVTLQGSGILQANGTLPTVHLGDKDFPVTKVDGCGALPGNGSSRDVQSCASATFVIPRGTFPPGQYALTLKNPDPASCQSSDAISITVVPPPVVTAIAPDLVCDAQGDQTMTVTGTGFLQIGTALPGVIVGTTTFMPAMISGCMPVPAMTSTVQTCTTMTFVLPKGTFPEGDYPVVVQNPPPAGCKSLETVNLHVAPPPSIAGVNPLGICDAQGNQQITLDGAGFLQVGTTLPTVTIGTMAFTPAQATGCVTVPGTFTEGVVQECTGLVVTVPQGTFMKGTYPVTVQNPPPADCSSTETVNLTVEDPPVVTGTAPATLCQGGGNLTVNGQSFLPGASVSLTATGQTAIPSSGTMVNAAGTQIAATFGGGATPGNVYDVVVDNGDGCSDAPPHQKVTIVTGPVAFFADPEVVFNGINTRATIYATTLMQPLPVNAVTIVPAGMTTPVTQLNWNSVPGHPNRVQVIVPQGQAPGVYDLRLNDATGCSTVLPGALTVTATLSVALASVVPPFGWNQEETSVTILRNKTPPMGMTAPFVATPRVFLNPTSPLPSDIAIQVASVSFLDAGTLTAVVPKGQPAHAYDLIVVNPDGTVGYLASAFTVQSVAPPTIGAVTPSSIVAATGQAVVVSGKNFSGSTVSATCKDAMGNAEAPPPVTFGAPVCPGAGVNCTQAATLNGSALTVGSICLVRVTNADGSYFDFSAVGVTNSSLNLPGTHAGTNLNVGRRALVSAAGNATSSARFLYAIGGDGGAAMAGTPFSSTEVASVDLFGNLGAWTVQAQSALGTPRAFAASTTVGRYVYVAGGSDGTTALASAERAMILNPSEVPFMDIDDLVPAAAGLDPGYWFYRVSASFAAGDADNPGGESLPSDEFIVKVPAFAGKKIQVVLAWTAPVDALGAPLPNVTGYNVYRTAMVDGASGGEVRLATVGAGTLKYTDDGSATPGTQAPLPLGSMGQWKVLPAMATARKGAAGASGFDPGSASTFYVYAMLGLGAANNPLTGYEYLPVTIQPNGHQTVGTWTAGSAGVAQGRWQLGAWVADSTVSSTIPAGTTYVYFGGGVDQNNAAANQVDAGKIAAGGDLGALNATPKDFSSNSAGYGVCAANGQLFAFGGAGATPSSGAKSASLVAPAPALANNSWNAEGLNLVDARYLMGSSVQSAFIFLVGGQTAASAASKTTEFVIW
jgi:hypothetical protein